MQIRSRLLMVRGPEAQQAPSFSFAVFPSSDRLA